MRLLHIDDRVALRNLQRAKKPIRGRPLALRALEHPSHLACDRVMLAEEAVPQIVLPDKRVLRDGVDRAGLHFRKRPRERLRRSRRARFLSVVLLLLLAMRLDVEDGLGLRRERMSVVAVGKHPVAARAERSRLSEHVGATRAHGSWA